MTSVSTVAGTAVAAFFLTLSAAGAIGSAVTPSATPVTVTVAVAQPNTGWETSANGAEPNTGWETGGGTPDPNTGWE